MLRGLPASIAVHAAVIGASYVTWPYWGMSGRTYVSDFEAVEVNFAELGEITNIAPLVEEPPEEEPEAAEEVPEEPVEEDPVEEELPEAEEDVSDVDAALPAEPNPEDVLPDFEADPDPPEDAQEQKPEPRPQQRANSALDSLLNASESTFQSEIATRRKQPEPEPVTRQPQTALKDAPQPVQTNNPRSAGERNANIVRLEALMYSRVKVCWAGVDDLPYPEDLNVRMKVELNLNGMIEDLSLIDPLRRPIGNSPMGTAVDRALRAVNKCAPYKLPRDEYDDWKDININLGLAFEPD